MDTIERVEAFNSKLKIQNSKLVVGSAVAEPGELVYGWFDGPELPTGGVERLPVMIAQGREAGPVFWITANIHGDELTGVPAIHTTITAELAQELRGTVVAIPSLNPSGLRIGEREGYYGSGDPNRTFPDYIEKADDDEPNDTPSVYEDLMQQLYAEISRTADYLIDLHCYSRVATPFSIRDRVLYRSEADRDEALALHKKLAAMVKAFGLPVVNEFPAGRYIKRKLHRSTSGIALNEGRIPSFTVELGATDYVNQAALQACQTGILNLLKWAGMLEGELEPVTSVPVPQPDFEVMRESLPLAPASGLIQYRLQPGDLVKEGDIVAVLTDIFGRETHTIRSQHDGWIMSHSRGLVVYQGQSVANTAVRDPAPLVEPFPN